MRNFATQQWEIISISINLFDCFKSVPLILRILLKILVEGQFSAGVPADLDPPPPPTRFGSPLKPVSGFGPGGVQIRCDTGIILATQDA